MMQWLFLPTIVVFVLAVFPINAQKNGEKENERAEQRSALIEQLLADSQNLGLPENRAFISAKIGAMLWKSEPERARSLFLSAGNDLLTAIGEAEISSRRSGNHPELVNGGSLRRQILDTVAAYDAELALELFFKTRPDSVTRSLAAPDENGKISNSNNRHLAREENMMEQRLLHRAAEQSPDRLVRLLIQALAKPASQETIAMLRKLHQKDPAAAKEIADTIADRAIGAKFGPDQAGNFALETAHLLLNEFLQNRETKERIFSFDEVKMRSLAKRLTAYYLGGGARSYFNQQILNIAEKLDPAKVEQLKALPQMRDRWNGGYNDPKFAEIINSSRSGREMIAAAGDFPTDLRQTLYHNAVSKFAQNGEFDAARQFITETYSGETRDEMMHNLRTQQTHNFMGKGLFDEAERLILEMPEKHRFYSLITLATSVYQRNKVENRSRAESIIGKARSLLPETIENSEDLRKYFQVTSSYSLIESPEGPALAEQLIPLLNDLANASQVISPFQGNTNVRRGEFIIYSGSILNNFGFDQSVFLAVARKSLPESLRLTNLFPRRELRVGFQLQILENLR